MIVDCDRKRDHTPVTCGVIDKVTDPDVGGVEIITCGSLFYRSFCVCTRLSRCQSSVQHSDDPARLYGGGFGTAGRNSYGCSQV